MKLNARTRWVRTRTAGSITLVLLLVAALVIGGGVIAGCGEKAAEKAIEKAIEQAAKEQGQDVDVDVNVKDGSGSIKISGAEGETQWQTGNGMEPPEGFPTSLIPQGVKIIGSWTTSDNKTIAFESEKKPKEIFDYYLKALPDAGYEITQKLNMETSDGVTIGIAAKKAGTNVVVSGGGESGGVYTYSVAVTEEQ